MSETQASTASKVAGALLGVTGLLGIVILATDQILKETAPTHVYALAVFVIVDFVVAGLVFAKPTKMNFTLAALWSALRVIIQIADASQAHIYQMRYREFADYLFNPTMTTSPNPPGVPGAIIDLIIILEIIVILVAWGARASK